MNSSCDTRGSDLLVCCVAQDSSATVVCHAVDTPATGHAMTHICNQPTHDLFDERHCEVVIMKPTSESRPQLVDSFI